MGFAAGSPLWAAEDPVMGPINIHEFEELARRNLHMKRLLLLLTFLGSVAFVRA